LGLVKGNFVAREIDMGFWSELVSPDNSKVSTPQVMVMIPQVILICTGTILMALSFALIIYHCFYHRKGIDSETVKLILGLLGGGALNALGSYFSKTTATTTVLSGEAPAPPAAAKESGRGPKPEGEKDG
jgi:hypothetical protein